MENQNRSMTGIHKPDIYSYGVAILMFLTGLSALFSCSYTDDVKEDVLMYAENYFSPRSASHRVDSIRLSMISDAKMNIGSDSVFYSRMKSLCRSMFENGEQVDAIGYLNGLLDIFRHDGASESNVDFRAYCCLLLGAAYDEVGLAD